MTDIKALFSSEWMPEALIPARPRLLIVDDQPVNIQVLYQIFGKDSEVFMATSGQQALEVCRQKSPDLILLDVVMPEMDGIEVCTQLKADPETHNIPVIFVTSQDSPEEETKGLEVGAVDFITKPVNPAVVRARVKTHLTLKVQADALRTLASIDGLTRIPNRRLFDDRLAGEWRACRRANTQLSIIMIDVDHFKKYNDHYGHLEGDTCLKEVANVLRDANWRGRDLAARYGGEEFVCLLPETDLDGALTKAESLRTALENLALPHAASTNASCVTISVGVATIYPKAEDGVAALLGAADEQLYKAKQGGRNRVEGCDLG
ncbi:diguanylate cyclase [Zhongshania guokunii]|uniref:diguanylate cyclase n=1 Tax=Zhongshania guokunii TaxID=641783 RepID=A0ABV3U7G3_9GAMM